MLLKSIEEPPPQTVWLLYTPNADDVLPTIRSRCRLVTLRIPPPDAVAELLVRRDGADPELAARAARASQSHIGLARHLAKDPGAWERRRRLLLAPVSLRSVSDVELVKNKETKECFPLSDGYAGQVQDEALVNNNIIIEASQGCNKGQSGDGIVISPAFIVTKEDIDMIVDKVDKALTAVEKRNGF